MKLLMVVVFLIVSAQVKAQADTLFNLCYYETILTKQLKKADIEKRFGNFIDKRFYKIYNPNTKEHDIPQFEYDYRVFNKFQVWTILTVSIKAKLSNPISYIKVVIPSQSQWFLDTQETKKCGFSYVKTLGSINKDLQDYYLKDNIYCTVTNSINSSRKVITLGLKKKRE